MKTRSFRKIELAIPAYWAPEEALAVFDLIDNLGEKIWAYYGLQLQDLIAEQHQPSQSDQQDPNQTNLPF